MKYVARIELERALESLPAGGVRVEIMCCVLPRH